MNEPGDIPNPQALHYQGKRPRIPPPPRNPQEQRWFYGRLLFLAGLLTLFCLIAFVIGPHEILFGKLTSLQLTDLIPEVQKDGIPVVRAIKEYQRDHGSLPSHPDDLVPRYLPTYPKHPGLLVGNKYEYLTVQGTEAIIYDFTPGAEKWEVMGGFISGPLPLPPVVLPPSTSPATSK